VQPPDRVDSLAQPPSGPLRARTNATACLSRWWLVALGVSSVAIPLGIAKGLRGRDADNCGDQLLAQILEAQAQTAALQAQVRDLQARAASLAAAAARDGVILPDLRGTIANLNQVETQVNNTQSEITRALSDISGGDCSSTQLSQVPTVFRAQQEAFAAVQSVSNRLNQSEIQYDMDPSSTRRR